MNALAEAGRDVPGDVSVIGFDDLRLAAYTAPPLTTIRQPAVEIGRQATEILFGLIDGRRVRKLRYLLEPTLVVRGSTAPPPRSKRT